MKSTLKLKPGCAALLLAVAAWPAQAVAEGETLLPEVQVNGSQDRSENYRTATSATGSKTDTPVRDVPASLIAIPKAVLEDQGAVGMNEAMRNVSGVSQNYAGGYGFSDNFNIRGLNMRWLRDGSADGSTQNGYYRTMTDVESLEVLKGPGSALYGSSQPGGSVNVVTKQPMDKTLARVEIGAGSYDSQRIGMDFGGAVAGAATRLNIGYEKSDGYRGLGREIMEILPSVRFKLSDTQTLTLDYDYRDINLTPDNYGIVFGFDRKPVKASGNDARYYSPMNDVDQKINRIAATHEWKPSDVFGLKTSLVYDHRDIGILRNAGANVANAANVVTGRTIRRQSDDTDYIDFTSEAIWKFKTGMIGHTLLAGVELQQTEIDTVRVGYNLPTILDARNPVVRETTIAGLTAVAAQGFNRQLASTTQSAYVQDQLAITEQVKLRGGLRYDNVDFSDEGAQGTTAFRRIADQQDLSSGQLGAVYQPIPELSLYAGISRGAFINIATESTALSVEPETSYSKEIGAKAMLFDGRLDLNVALFKARRDNYYVQLTPGVSTADGKDETSGVEVDAIGALSREVKLLASYSHINPKVVSSALSSNATLGVSNTGIYGNMPTGVAKETGRLWLTWEPVRADLYGFGAGLGATYKGESYADALNLLEVPSYTVFDAAVYWRQKKWDVTVNFKNLTDRTYYTVPTFIGALPGDPRSVMATVRFDLN